ncbi:MAG: ribonuclease P protein component [Actinomycetota bacterium]
MRADNAAKGGYPFARRYRLTKTDEFSSVFGFRRAIRGQLLMLHYLPREDAAGDPRLGLVVGKKLLKAAVRRNLVKRLVREQFRLLRPGLPPCDLIVRLVTKPGQLDRKAIAAEAVALFGKLAQRMAKPGGADRK